MVAKVWATDEGIVEMTPHRGIDGDTLFPQYLDRRGADPVPSGTVDRRNRVEILLDFAAQARELFRLQIARQIAGIGIVVADFLDQRRIDPWVQLDADFGIAAG